MRKVETNFDKTKELYFTSDGRFHADGTFYVASEYHTESKPTRDIIDALNSSHERRAVAIAGEQNDD